MVFGEQYALDWLQNEMSLSRAKPSREKADGGNGYLNSALSVAL